MKRLHVNLAVDDIEGSIRFYSALFAAEPTVRKPDYAKWMLDDPRVNFAISDRAARKGLDHLGIQVESEAELHEVYGRLRDAAAPTYAVGATTCCYARSEKTWITDPQGVAWEAFLTVGESPVYGEDIDVAAATAGNCCPPQREAEGACC
ncbi:MAG: ArsI/CadI family heavy metal resistance metalloenzyme [Alphaproteobacteria bacterium]